MVYCYNIAFPENDGIDKKVKLQNDDMVNVMDESPLYQSSYITVKAIGNEQAENDEDLVEIQPHDDD